MTSQTKNNPLNTHTKKILEINVKLNVVVVWAFLGGIVYLFGRDRQTVLYSRNKRNENESPSTFVCLSPGSV